MQATKNDDLHHETNAASTGQLNCNPRARVLPIFQIQIGIVIRPSVWDDRYASIFEGTCREGEQFHARQQNESGKLQGAMDSPTAVIVSRRAATSKALDELRQFVYAGPWICFVGASARLVPIPQCESALDGVRIARM